MILEKEKQLHVSALRPSSGWILGLNPNQTPPASLPHSTHNSTLRLNSTCYQTTPTVQLHHLVFSIRSTTRLHNLDLHSGFPRITTEEKTVSNLTVRILARTYHTPIHRSTRPTSSTPQPQNPSEVQEHTWTSPRVLASQRTLKTPCGIANHPHIGSNKHTQHPQILL
jgi:hypothetical protein